MRNVKYRENAVKNIIKEQKPKTDDFPPIHPSLPYEIRTWENFVQYSNKTKPIPFSKLQGKYRKQVDCCVNGIYRDRVSSSSHFYEHAISYERE